MIELAKPAVDVGLFTNERDAMLTFWQQQVGVAFAELLPIGGGGQQHQHATIQVFDVVACHGEILAKGGREGRAPVKLGDVAHISFVRDPDGNWIEVSQRKSITGSLD